MLTQNITSCNSGSTTNGFGVSQAHTGSFFDVFATNLYINCGTGSISGSTATVTDGYIKATSIIMLTKTSSTSGELYVSSVGSGTATITGPSGCTFNYLVVNPAHGPYGY